MKVLVVEDEKKIADFMIKGLEARGFAVDACDNGDDALILALTRPYDTIILDIMLPGKDGISILKSMRLKGVNTPVIAVSARSELDDRITGLDAGADDYLAKPFFVDELIARLHAINRRTTGAQLNLRRVGELSLNLATREVLVGEVRIDLSPREFNLLEFLMRSPGRVYTRTQIMEYVWQYDFDPNTNIVDVCIKRIRKKLAEASPVNFVETIRGVGYRMIREPS